MNEIEVLYQDNALLVLNKPSGLMTVPGKGEGKLDCVESRMQAAFTDALIVHRLDQSTSGIVIMARGKESQRVLNKAFANRTIDKQYIAVVDGVVAPTHGIIDLPLNRDWPNRPKQKIDYQNGKASQTHFSVVDRNIQEQTTRLLLFPKTGRTHQLRMHMREFGHTILGDRLYATDIIRQKAPRLLLHSEKIELTHPHTQQRMTLRCAPPF